MLVCAIPSCERRKNVLESHRQNLTNTNVNFIVARVVEHKHRNLAQRALSEHETMLMAATLLLASIQFLSFISSSSRSFLLYLQEKKSLCIYFTPRVRRWNSERRKKITVSECDAERAKNVRISLSCLHTFCTIFRLTREDSNFDLCIVCFKRFYKNLISTIN